uniref:Mastoparan PDD-A n=1 Tax=Polistes dorsalis TaxID=34729 RepID=MASTA_POLDR|nr:RecName: Full=Mastoparan PDD-A [Polistes dorsalis]
INWKKIFEKVKNLV